MQPYTPINQLTSSDRGWFHKVKKTKQNSMICVVDHQLGASNLGLHPNKS